jgi:hypothetical protein
MNDERVHGARITIDGSWDAVDRVGLIGRVSVRSAAWTSSQPSPN